MEATIREEYLIKHYGNGGGHEHMAGGFISYDKLERKDAAGIREIIKNRFMSEVNKVNK